MLMHAGFLSFKTTYGFIFEMLLWVNFVQQLALRSKTITATFFENPERDVQVSFK